MTGQRERNGGGGGGGPTAPTVGPVRPVAPPGDGGSAAAAAGPKLPPSTKGLIAVKLAPEVLAAAQAKRPQQTGAGMERPSGAARNVKPRPNQGPFYPSSDPDRLGTKNNASTSAS